MSSDQKHSVQKVSLEINTASLKTAYYLRDNLDTFVKNEVFPLLEKYFDKIQPKNKTGTGIMQVNKLHIDLNLREKDLDGNFNHLKELLQNRLKKETEKLSVASENRQDYGKIREVSPERRRYNTFFHFVKTGQTPWWASADEINTLSQPENIRPVLVQKSFKRDFDAILKDKIAIKRLIRQFPGPVLLLLFKTYCRTHTLLRSVIAALSEESNTPLPSENGPNTVLTSTAEKISEAFLNYMEKAVEISSPHQKEQFWNLMAAIVQARDKTGLKQDLIRLGRFLSAAKETKESAGVLKGILNIFPAIRNAVHKIEPADKETEKKKDNAMAVVSGEKNDPDNELTMFSSDTEKEIFVENAGLILLHPFLKPFFLDCGVITPDNMFIDGELATHLLHYAATGRETDTENTMLLEKFLCTIAVHHPITREIPLSEAHKKKSEELLSSLTTQWGALKNTSAETVRNEFIQRPGKLILEKDNPRIIVERRTQDILLDKLPWNISIIKIPWIKKLIFVEW